MIAGKLSAMWAALAMVGAAAALAVNAADVGAQALQPVITGVSPSAGSSTTAVTISGQNFDDVDLVYFGPDEAAAFTVVSSTTITAMPPSGQTPGTTVHVLVRGPGGVSDLTPADQFTFLREGDPNALGTRIYKSRVDPDRGNAIFFWRGSGDYTGFECGLAKGKRKPKFRRCESPARYEALKTGEYTFYARSVGPPGVDGTPAKTRFRIK